MSPVWITGKYPEELTKSSAVRESGTFENNIMEIYIFKTEAVS